MLRTLVLAALLFLASSARAGLDELYVVDAVAVNKNTGEVALLLFINRPLEDGLTKRRVAQKLEVYATYLKSSAFRKKYPFARGDLPAEVEIQHPPKRSALGQSVLEQIEGQAKELGLKAKFTQIEWNGGR